MEFRKDFILVVGVFYLFSLSVFSQTDALDSELPSDDLYEMSLEELMAIPITSASNVKESLTRAPATIIVISATEIVERGYIEMYDVLNDLPGFDLSRAFGDDAFYLYARGYRKETSDQMLLMIDGVSMNHLYSNNMNLFSMYPLSNVSQIEIVYGPASAVYGPNAFAGVINIITKREGESTASIFMGENSTFVTELNILEQINDVQINVTARIFDSNGFDFSDRTPALDARLYEDPNLWGPFMETDFIGYQSPINAHFASANLHYNGFTVGFVNFLYESGYGAEWPGDKVLNSKLWGFTEETYFARYETDLLSAFFSKPLLSKSTIRYRQSGHPNNSIFVNRYSGGADASYWQTTNTGLSFFQDFSYTYSDFLSANVGLKYERRNLQGAYEEIYGDFWPSDTTASYVFPDRPQSGITAHNHFLMKDLGAYLQTRITPMEKLDLILGLRFDNNSIFGDVYNPRTGVVYELLPGLVSKFFYGQAYLEPTARVLYGGWQGSMSNVNLRPERIQTYEGTLFLSQGRFYNGINVFFNQGYDVIAGAENIGERKMFGVEYASKFQFNRPFDWLHRFKGDVFVSYIQSEENFDDGQGWQTTGNMAPIKLKYISTAYFTRDFSLSLQNRYISEIETVSSNPIDKIDAHFTSDIYLRYRNFLVEGITIGVRVSNIFDVEYYHPGYRGASAGENFVFLPSGSLDETVSGSTGWYNSRLPQPGRHIMFHAKLNF